MGAPTSITKFFNAAERPPIMGWHYYRDLNDRETYFRKDSAEGVLEELKRQRVNNGKFVSDFDLWRELWDYWCSREPTRCGYSERTPAAELPAGPLIPRDINPPFFGPIIWRMMNLVAARFDAVGHAQWLDFINIIHPTMTCPDCRQEWRKIVREHPPGDVHTTREACEWACRVHNIVNDRRGAPQYHYSRGVVEYGWPV